MMGYKETDDVITLTMSREDYERLLMAIGIATGWQSREGQRIRDWLEFVNRINVGNLRFVPYSVDSVEKDQL